MTDRLTILQGDVLARLAELPDASCHLCCTSPPYFALRSYLPADHPDKAREIGLEPQLDCGGWLTGAKCGRCWICAICAVFSEVKRVMRADGTCWVNIGSSYDQKQDTLQPSRLALALQAQGWFVRSQIVWAKANPMPESVTDRPTSAHETIWLLSKSPTYFYDAEAVREKAEYGRREWHGGNGYKQVGNSERQPTREMGSAGAAHPETGRNLRNVWNISTHAYPEAHFATFSPEIPKRAILAGTSQAGVCPHCAAPWRRVVETKSHSLPVSERKGRVGHNGNAPQQSGYFWTPADRREVGWQATCACPGITEEDLQPATVLDPFAGSGTTGMVALELGRNAVLIELNADYCDLIRKRCAPALAQELLPL